MTKLRTVQMVAAATLLLAGGLASAKSNLAVIFTPDTTPAEQKRMNFAGIVPSRPRSDAGMMLRIYGPDASNHDDPVVTVNPGDNLVFIDWVGVQSCAAHWLNKASALQNEVVAGLCRALIVARTDGWRAAGRTGDAPDVTP